MSASVKREWLTPRRRASLCWRRELGWAHGLDLHPSIVYRVAADYTRALEARFADLPASAPTPARITDDLCSKALRALSAAQDSRLEEMRRETDAAFGTNFSEPFGTGPIGPKRPTTRPRLTVIRGGIDG